MQWRLLKIIFAVSLIKGVRTTKPDCIWWVFKIKLHFRVKKYLLERSWRLTLWQYVSQVLNLNKGFDNGSFLSLDYNIKVLGIWCDGYIETNPLDLLLSLFFRSGIKLLYTYRQFIRFSQSQQCVTVYAAGYTTH